MNHVENLSGKRFGKLLVLSRGPNNHRGDAQWVTQCDCGGSTLSKSYNLTHKKSTSCGCWERTTKHKMSLTPEYGTWQNIQQRCENSKNKNFSSYGGRGITVSPEWSEFDVFFADMGQRPSSDHSIERINNSKGYSKDNCKWATRSEQQRNKRSNSRVLYHGDIFVMAEFAEKFGFKRDTLYHWVNRGVLEQKIPGLKMLSSDGEESHA